MFFFIVNRRRFSKCPRPILAGGASAKGPAFFLPAQRAPRAQPARFWIGSGLCQASPCLSLRKGLVAGLIVDVADVTDFVSPVVSFPKVWGEWR